MKKFSKVIAIFVLVNLIFTNVNFASNDTEDITIKDKNAYNYTVTQLKEQGISINTNDDNQTITIEKSDIDKVTKLDFCGSVISNVDGIEKFSNLKELNLSNNNITENEKNKFIDNMPKIESIEKLDLSSNMITYLDGIDKFKNLKELNLYDNNVKDIKSLSKMTNLESLNLGENNNITNEEILSKLVNLKTLDLSETYLSNVYKYVYKLTNLENLNLMSCSMVQDDSKNCLDGIDNLTNLKTLNLSFNTLRDFSSLSKLSNLEELNLSHNQWNGDITPFVKDGKVALPNLKKFDIVENNSKSYASSDGLRTEELHILKNNVYQVAYDYVPDDVKDLPHTDSNGIKYVTYDDFGAKCDGSYDDSIAMLNAHNFANKVGCEVRATEGKTYHIYKYYEEPIVINTNTNWNNANFVIHDEQIYKYVGRKKPLFYIQNLTDNKDIKEIENPSFTINKSTKKINEIKDTISELNSKGYKKYLCIAYNNTKKQYIRYGVAGDTSGFDQEDAFTIDSDCNLLNDVQWDFDKITSLYIYPISNTKQTIQNGNFTTNSLDTENETITRPNSGKHNYIYRTLSFKESGNFEISNINHTISKDVKSGSYYGFATLNKVADAEFKDSKLFARKFTYSSTYDFVMNNVVNFVGDNLTQDNIQDSDRWGVMGNNYCKDIVFKNCTLNRIDGHMGYYNLEVDNCTLGHHSLTLTGQGNLNIKNSTFNSNKIISLRGDYGSTWNGDCNITDCKFVTEKGIPQIIEYTIKTDDDGSLHEFGYTCKMPNINIKNLTIDNSANIDDQYKFGVHMFACNDWNQYTKAPKEYWPDKIRVEDLKIINCEGNDTFKLTEKPCDNFQGDYVVVNDNMGDSVNEFTESYDSLTNNPNKGFYRTDTLYLKQSGNKAINPKSETSNLNWLCVELSDFSGAQNKSGKDVELTDDALNALDETLANIKNNNQSVILRFVYDKNNDGIKNSEGKLDENGQRYVEPSIDMICKHISQMKGIFNKYESTILNIQMGMFGAYGELHSTSMCTQENFNKALDAYIANTPDDITISVRTPAQWLGWAKTKDDSLKDITISNISKVTTTKGQDIYRVGMYDDGYLGDESDLGTYSNRYEEINWLKNQTLHTPFGGEALPNYDDSAKVDGYDYINKYSLMTNFENEARKTHTTYLNYEWDQKLLNEWKKNKYNSYDYNFRVKDGYSDYDYVESHLGYRLILRKSLVSEKVSKNDKIKLQFSIENKGFSPVIKKTDGTIIFVDENGNKVYSKTLDNFDVRNILNSETYDEDSELDIPSDLKDGKYKVYLQLSSGYLDDGTPYLPIQFANYYDWNDDLKANYLGYFVYSKAGETNSSTDSKDNTSNSSSEFKDNTQSNNSSSSKDDSNKSSNNEDNNASSSLNSSSVLFEDFNNKLDSSKWLVANKAWGGNNHGVVPENVLVDNGILRLFGNGNNYTGNVKGYKSDEGTRTGACLVTKDYYGSGSYEIKAKLPQELGACSAMWTFEYEEYYPGSEEFEKLAPNKNASYYVVNHEIDIELPGRPDGAKSATDYNYALCNTFVGERENEYASTHAKLESAVNDGKYHTYRFDWHTGSSTESKRVDFYVDNKLIATNTTHVPTNRGRFWVGIWFPNGWAGDANFDTTEFDVDYVKITSFNEEGDTIGKETYSNDGWGDLSKVRYNLTSNNTNSTNKSDTGSDTKSNSNTESNTNVDSNNTNISNEETKSNTKSNTISNTTSSESNDKKSNATTEKEPNTNTNSSSNEKTDLNSKSNENKNHQDIQSSNNEKNNSNIKNDSSTDKNKVDSNNSALNNNTKKENSANTESKTNTQSTIYQKNNNNQVNDNLTTNSISNTSESDKKVNTNSINLNIEINDIEKDQQEENKANKSIPKTGSKLYIVILIMIILLTFIIIYFTKTQRIKDNL